MAEREAVVVSCAGGRLGLRLLGSACDGCVGGCGGRCNLFAGDGQGVVELEVPADARHPPGQRLRVAMDDAALRRAAWRGYGRVLLGLLAGAAAGQALGLWLGRHADALSLAGLVLGTFLVARFSKPRLPGPVLLPARAHDNPENTTES
ncbi:SoxR reducing system RseC family protein [Arenimonas caeni]|jgi:hypothetical protein|uniref:SoxR reducing system RseC family protein n=1 Tax=Arenimonas caeni TaxID=2058085 RepID=A0A2P6M6I3_9GAMM|nr:SoxR reducing system RseC family protein [Arenimonas caeni]MDY0022036.1 SoxR reducing system RseC family protein [Arenimonas caeni]PRH81596.1 hypothetical protein C6N40_11550 [Arenimonas caeni]